MESSLTRRCDVCGYRYDAAMGFCPRDRSVLPPPKDDVADLGNYRLVERLADGGMGAVYRAVHRRLGRNVAIKLLQKDLSSDRGIINRFFHEARAANTIRHEHVIEVYDFVESGQDVYFVMEFLRGEDLHDAIHGHDRESGAVMDPRRAVHILEQIASALHATHARNIIHRDLKPENVFLAEKDGTRDYVKIFDFGVAKLERPDGRSTIEGAVLGTPEYMAPEQARGGAVDGRADIYSLGCIAYEMLTRRQIFGGGTHSEVLVRQLTQMPPPPRSLVPSIPPALDAVVMRALSKDPSRRPQSALELAEALAGALGRGLDNPAAFRTITRPTPSLGQASARTPSPLGPLVLRKDRRNGGKLVALVTATLMLVVAGAVATRKLKGFGTAGEVATAAGAEPVVIRPTPLCTVLLQSVPSGAAILDEQGNQIGVTPHDLVLPRGHERQVRFQKDGFRPAVRRFAAQGDTTIAVYLDPDEKERPSHPQRPAGGKGHSDPGALDSMAGTIDPFHR